MGDEPAKARCPRWVLTALGLAAVLAGSAQALTAGTRLPERTLRSFALVDVEAGPLRVTVASIRF